MNKEEHFNPFPGLRSFEEEEDYLFFGREKQIDELISKLGKTRFLAVVGASGSGKSSLVKSGLLPSLHSGFMVGANSGWRICTLRPGNDPIGNLSQALSTKDILGNIDENIFTTPIIESILRRNENGVSEVLRQLSENHNQNILIVVDQFEELFRYSKYEKDENRGTHDSVTFINLLLAASKSKGISIYVVFTMRSDYVGDCTGFRGLPEAINEGQYLIPRMTRDERKIAITGPIAVGGAKISQSLLTCLLNDVGDNPDQLPILQHALMRTWEYWKKNSKADDVIDLIHYEAIGTMTKALSLHAEEAYDEIADEKGKEVCKKIFRSLTEKVDRGRGTRRPSQVKEICELAEINISEVTRVIDVFRKPGRSFLMPPIGIELTEDTVIDIAHESLMRVWERLITWVNEEIESAEIYTRLAEAATLYQEGKTGLWRDPELQMAINWKENQKPNQIWAKRYNLTFDSAIKFLEDSQLFKNRAIVANEKKRKSAILRLRVFIAFILLAFCMSLYFGITSHYSEKKAKYSEKIALIKKQQADSLKIIADKERDIASNAKDIAFIEEQKAEKEKIIAMDAKMDALNSYNLSLKSLELAKIATKTANDSANSAIIQRKSAFNSAIIARKEKENTEKAKEEIDRLRLLAEARNIAIRSRQLVNNPNKDTISLQLSILAYAINRQLNGPIQNRFIYLALKDQLDKYYTKNLRSRKDLSYELSSYDNKSVAFLSETEFITAGDEGVINKYQIVGNPKEIKRISTSKKYPESFTNVCVTPDQKFVFAGTTKGTIVNWNPSDKLSLLNIIYKGFSKIILLSNISSNVKDYNVVSVCENNISIVKIDKNKLSLIKKTDIYSSTNNKIKSAAIYTENNLTHLFFSEEKSGYELIIDSNDSVLKRIKIIDFPEVVSAMAISKTGEYLNVGGVSGQLISFKRVLSNYLVYRKLGGHLSTITSIKFSSNDSFFASGSLDHSINVSQTLKSNSEHDLVFEEKPSWIRNIELTPNNNYIIAVGQSNLIQIWPSQLKVIINDIKGIKEYHRYFENNVNEQLFKDELGDELFERIWKLNSKNNNFSDFWNEIKSKL
jgi:WD40 repeat protein